MDAIPLSMLVTGQSGRVSQIAGRADQAHRLREMGLRDNAIIEMLQPGRPCIIRVNGQRLCFRDDDLLRVLVRPLALEPLVEPARVVAGEVSM